MANLINTVLGQVGPEKLGRTLVHEHIVGGYAGWECDALSRPYNRDKIAAICCKTVGPVKEYGVNSIIDATPIDLSRDADVLKVVSEQLGLNVICSTGMYTEELGKWSYLKMRSRSKIGDMASELYDTYMLELTQGIAKTGVKAGVIKVATGLNKISECEMASLKAAARAQKATGVPIITHTEDGTMGPEQLDILIAEGADRLKIMCGHMCCNSSFEYHLEVLKRGTFVALDRFGVEVIMPDDVRKALLIGLIGLGYTGRIMISHDCFGCGFGRGGVLPEKDREVMKNWNFTNIFRNILPAIKKAGITDKQIDTIMTDNPARLFA
jgi:phosphotriesterase-related protein